MSKVFIGIKIGLLFVGTIIGAGFASGKELLSFFGGLGLYIIPVSICVGVLFFLTAFLFLKIGAIIRPKRLQDMTKAIFGKVGGGVFDALILISYFVVFSAMLAGVDSIFVEGFGYSSKIPIFSLITAGIAVVVIMYGMKGLVGASSILVPFIVVFIFAISIATFVIPPENFSPQVEVASSNVFKDIVLVGVNSILYVSMNMLMTSAVLGEAGVDLKNSTVLWGSALGGAIIMVCVVLILFAIAKIDSGILNVDLPMMYIANKYGAFWVWLCAIVIWCAVFTTLTASVYPIVAWSDRYVKKKYITIPIIFVIGFLIASFGFSKIVNFLFPFMGAVGMFFIISSIIYYFKQKNKDKRIDNFDS